MCILCTASVYRKRAVRAANILRDKNVEPRRDGAHFNVLDGTHVVAPVNKRDGACTAIFNAPDSANGTHVVAPIN